MRTFLSGLILAACMVGTLFATPNAEVTFHKEVMPILQKHCQGCHRPGEVAPMSFLSYERFGLGRRRSARWS